MAEERVQRRLAAILIADVVGYSRMMEADEASTQVPISAEGRLNSPGSAEEGCESIHNKTRLISNL